MYSNVLRVMSSAEGFLPLARTILIVAVLFLIASAVLQGVKKGLLRRARTKGQISNIEVLTQLFRYIILVTLVVFGALSYWGSGTGFGISVGLITAAIGFSLQKPIANIAAFIMIIIKRPFVIGDHIVVGAFQGEVKEINTTHTILRDEAGQKNGASRTIIIPNYLFLEQPIVNITNHSRRG